MMDELKDVLTAVFYVLVFVLIIGFIGWYTEPPEPVRYHKMVNDNLEGVFL